MSKAKKQQQYLEKKVLNSFHSGVEQPEESGGTGGNGDTGGNGGNGGGNGGNGGNGGGNGGNGGNEGGNGGNEGGNGGNGGNGGGNGGKEVIIMNGGIELTGGNDKIIEPVGTFTKYSSATGTGRDSLSELINYLVSLFFSTPIFHHLPPLLIKYILIQYITVGSLLVQNI